MESEFWQQRWEQNDIGFHQPEINALLQSHWATLELDRGSTVFVPLCGKSRDMLWLRDQGFRVLGVELSEIAVQAFFHENHLPVSQYPLGAFQCYETENIRLLCGDFFALQPRDVAQCQGCYDRAALVAMPTALRRQYAAHLWSLLPPGARMLLITLYYPQEQMNGPPFAVTEWELFAYFSSGTLRKLAKRDALTERFAAKGLKEMTESAYFLQKP